MNNQESRLFLRKKTFIIFKNTSNQEKVVKSADKKNNMKKAQYSNHQFPPQSNNFSSTYQQNIFSTSKRNDTMRSCTAKRPFSTLNESVYRDFTARDFLMCKESSSIPPKFTVKPYSKVISEFSATDGLLHPTNSRRNYSSDDCGNKKVN